MFPIAIMAEVRTMVINARSEPIMSTGTKLI